MKILITTDLYETNTNGVAVSVRNLSEELRKRGHDVRILTLSENKDSHYRNSVYYVGSFSLEKVYPGVRGAFGFKEQYIKELVLWKPDVIHSQCEFFTFQFAKRIAKKTGTPLLHTYHTLYEQYSNYLISSETVSHFLIRKLTKWRLKHTTAVIVPSRKTEDVLKNYGVEKKLYVIPTGISLEQHHWRISQEERGTMRKKYGISENDFVLLSLGRLGAEKSLEKLLVCFSWVYDVANLKLMIVGDGPKKEALEDLASRMGISHKVIFTGMAESNEVQKYYQLGDVFVSTSTSETQGLTYVEAAANGLPLVCMRDPCLQGVLLNGVNGFEFATPEEFQYDILALLEDNVLCKKASEQSVEMANSFDKSRFAESVERIYQSIRQQKAGDKYGKRMC